MDANFFLCGLYLMPIMGAFGVFLGIGRLTNAEWTWNFERIARWHESDINRTNWEQWRYAGCIPLFVGTFFLLFGLFVACPAALSMR